MKTVAISTIVGAGIGGVGGFLYLGAVLATWWGPPAWDWRSYFEFFGPLYAMYTAMFGALVGLIVGTVYLVALEKGWPAGRSATVAALPSIGFAASVMSVVLLGSPFRGDDIGGVEGAAVFLACPALLFAAITFLLVQLLYESRRSPAT